MGSPEVISEADPLGSMGSDSDYKERACASTAVHTVPSVSTKDSCEWRGACCLVRVHRQARRCLFTPTWQADIWHGLKVQPTRKTYVTPVGQKKPLNPVIECQELSILESTSSCISVDRRDSLQGGSGHLWQASLSHVFSDSSPC